MLVLIINCGSSSLKYQLLDFADNTVMASGLCERIGIDNSRIVYCRYEEAKKTQNLTLLNHEDAVNAMIGVLTTGPDQVITGLEEIRAVGHRVVHGAERFTAPYVITPEVKAAIRETFLWGPLHNPANLLGIEVCEKKMPGIPQVAVFDTAFHQTMPAEAFVYPLPYEYYEKHGVRRYGFHGTSHRYVAERAAILMDQPFDSLKIVTCHLGNGSSICAVKNGQSIDTSMGLTPLAGLPMGTRCGDIDPAIVGFLGSVEGLTMADIDQIMNKRSGVLGISGISSDFRDIVEARNEGNERAALALNIFKYDLRKYIGSYSAAMGGLDAIVFTAGIGENDREIRADVCRPLGFLGVEIDDERNAVHGKEQRISSDRSRVAVFVIPTNEELAIARETVELLGLA